MRIVSICPSNTELLAYLNLIPHVVGVDNYSDWPNEIRTLPRLGPDLSIDLDKVEALRPDLVVASLSVPGMEKNIEGLKERGLPYITLNPNSLEDIADDLITLGELTDTKDLAEEIVKVYSETINFYRREAKMIVSQPKVYWEWWPKPVFTPGGENWLTEITELAGAKNVYGQYKKASVQTTWDDVVEKQPDHICMIWVGVDSHKVKPEFVLKRENTDKMKAIAKGNIHVLEEPYFCRPSPRLLIGLRKVAALLHPNVFPAFLDEDALIKIAQKRG
ncbi:iron complex transport system substrate-binding protein [Scopulibacillus darangshiensis]|uniref:Iron complex transport system substrate-binding protein n=1 Tax=Scopulibacillus darangshiensis TaxID=442528 RepID=A0A4V2SMA7_9BACL|nr:cobalamin-binding protein [Scopulibacillus darangshiensis]TCP26586.1 iron complex transport system substrate-binding protein [Scopulibacillus darangshiensis]